jgi:hypothetical protein
MRSEQTRDKSTSEFYDHPKDEGTDFFSDCNCFNCRLMRIEHRIEEIILHIKKNPGLILTANQRKSKTVEGMEK